MKKRIVSIVVLCCILLSMLPENVNAIETISTTSLSADTYYDKTLAGMLGHFAGFLTGYEFVWDSNGDPAEPLPDSYFSILGGPYSGNFTYGGDETYPGYDRFWANGVIASDDDFHVDIFNQHILSEHGPNVSYYDIKEEWKEHYVHDWGAGFMAAYLTRNVDMLPPFTGLREYGNAFYWCTEAYIENDTLGMATPGMPNKAIELAEKFASVTGDFDGIIWAKFGAALYALAYTETTAYDVVTKAAACLPNGSWPKEIYDTCLSLYQTETNWRTAVSTVAAMKRNVDESDNVQTLTDINNAIIIISLLYGDNDYENTLKISSLAGYDGDCNAATATGIMGVIKGTAGTPDSILQGLYPDGECTYINDLQTFFDPYIKLNYPREQTIDTIISQFQSNAEAVIIAEGGTVVNGIYTIVTSSIVPETRITINDYDFEDSTHTAWTSSGSVSFDAAEAHSGSKSAKLVSGSSLTQTLSGLTEGKCYRLTAYVKTSETGLANISVSIGSDAYTTVVRDEANYWIRRDLEFVSTSSNATITMSTGSDTSDVAYFDNITLSEIEIENKTIYEAESAQISDAEILTASSASGGHFVGTIDNSGSSLTFNVSVAETAEYYMEVRYANGGDYVSSHDLYINSVKFASVYYPKTARWDEFQDDYVRVPIELQSGNNTIKLQRNINYAQIDFIRLYKIGDTSIEAPSEWIEIVSDDYNYLTNGNFESAKANWDTWTGDDGSGAGADYVESNTGYLGSNCLVHSSPNDYEVYTSQTISNIPNGHYTLGAYVQSSGGQTKCYIGAKNYGPGLEQKITLPAFGDEPWIYVEIPGILVQNGTITIGIYSKADAGEWMKVDNISLKRETENLLTFADFESSERYEYWGIWPGTSGEDGDASYYESGGVDNSVRLTHCKASAYEVFTGQSMSHLQNGTYTLTAWVKGSGEGKHFVSVKNHGQDEIKYYVPVTDQWTQIIIRDIVISTNTCEVGLYSNASGNEWCSIDNLVFQKTNTYYAPFGTPNYNTNVMSNPSFEVDGNGTIDGWTVWTGTDGTGENASFLEENGYDGAWRLTHYKETAYEVFTGQTLSNLVPGRYTLSAWVIGDGTSTHVLSIKNHGNTEQTVSIPVAPYPQWIKIQITDVAIYNGTCEVGLYSNAAAGSWCSFDKIELILQNPS